METALRPRRSTAASRWAATAAGAGLAALASGCGGGAATMHPAHTLPQNRMTFGSGVSGHFVLGEADSAIARGRSAAAPGGSFPGDAEQAFLEGALADAALSPGIAPWVGARVGLGADNEAGLTYTGRTVRLDGRHSFEWDRFALSAGGGASAVLLRPGSSPPPDTGSPEPGAGRFIGDIDDFQASGWGLDLPVIVGWRSAGDVVQLWAGARGGFERLDGEILVAQGEAAERSAALDGNRWHLGALAGFLIGMDPLWVGLQLDASYESAHGRLELPPGTGDPEVREADLVGISLTPTGALLGKF